MMHGAYNIKLSFPCTTAKEQEVKLVKANILHIIVHAGDFKT